MERPTKEIILTQSKITVYLNKWINGKEAEYAEAPLLKAVSISGKGDIKKAEDISLGLSAETAVHENNHREVEVFVAKITYGEGEKKEAIIEKPAILKYILEEIPEEDYNEVLHEISQIQHDNKKK